MKTVTEAVRIECKQCGIWRVAHMEQLEVGDIVRYVGSPDYPDYQELVVTVAPVIGEEPTEPEPPIEYKCEYCDEPAIDYRRMCENHKNEFQAFIREKYKDSKGYK